MLGNIRFNSSTIHSVVGANVWPHIPCYLGQQRTMYCGLKLFFSSLQNQNHLEHRFYHLLRLKIKIKRVIDKMIIVFL